MRFLSLFAGIGGFDLGLEKVGMQCAGQVEIDPYCRAVLKKHWPEVKRMEDVRDVTGDEFGHIDLICGGVPCQPASIAGKRKGTADNRWLWPEAFRLVRKIQPAWCLFENVRGLASLESGVVFDTMLSELEGYGYEVQTFCIAACCVDAPHKRERLWIIAHSNSQCIDADVTGHGTGEICRGRPSTAEVFGNVVADPNEEGLQVRERPESSGTGENSGALTFRSGLPELIANAEGSEERAGLCEAEQDGEWRERFGDNLRWLPESGICRVANGIPRRVDRVKCLGNAVVPQTVEQIGKAIMKAEELCSRK